MDKLVIDKAAAQKLLDFLAKQKYVEVYEVVPLLLNLPTLDQVNGTSLKEEPTAKLVEETTDTSTTTSAN